MAPPRRGQLGSMRTISLSNLCVFEEKDDDDKRGSLNRSKSSMNLRLGDIEEETTSTTTPAATTTSVDKNAGQKPVVPSLARKAPVDRRSALSRSASVMELNKRERRRTPRRRVSATAGSTGGQSIFATIDETAATSMFGAQHHGRGGVSFAEMKNKNSKKPMVRRSISIAPSDSFRWAQASEPCTRDTFRKFLMKGQKAAPEKLLDDKSRRSREVLVDNKQNSMRNLRYSQAEIVNLVDNDMDFRLIQESLRQKGAVTNAVLQQGLPFYLHNIRDRDDFDLDITLRRPSRVVR